MQLKEYAKTCNAPDFTIFKCKNEFEDMKAQVKKYKAKVNKIVKLLRLRRDRIQFLQ